MRQRLLTLVLALGALLLFYQFFLPKPPPEQAKPSEPLSTDAGPDGELAMWQWLKGEGIAVASLRQRYGSLKSLASKNVGNVLITVMPHQTLIHNDEWLPLSEWIEAGNTLLVLAALDDTPRWSAATSAGWLTELTQLTHMAFSPIPRTDAAGESNGLGQQLRGVDLTLEPRGTHPLLSGVQNVHASSELASASIQSTPTDSHLSLTLMQRTDSKQPSLWLSRRGQGQLIVLSVASPLANREIDHADNARLLANILAWSRTPMGEVVFDDAHQGLSDYYDARAFFADTRLHRTLWWIALLWLAFVLGPLPLRSAFSPWRPVDETALIDASGRFYSNTVARQEAVRRLFENFFNRLRSRLNLPENGEPLWQWLASQGKVSSEQGALLQSLYARMCAEQRVDLARLQNLLTDLQGRLA
jgi:hypothetical protein